MAARRRIPTSFKLGSLTFHVRRVAPEVITKRAGSECYGYFDPDKQEILLEKASKRVTPALMYQTFLHELAHVFLWYANSRDYGDDKVVDAVGHALMQFLETRE